MKNYSWKSLFNKILFVSILLAFVVLVSYVLRDKTGRNRHTYFYEETTPVDLLVYGSSHTECAFSPMDLYAEYGIFSYNMGNSGEKVPMTYFNIVDSIERRCPKVIIVDLYMINEELSYYRDWDESRTITWQALDSVRFSKTKLVETYNLFKDKPLNERVELFFYLPRYHTRWKELTEMDFVIKPRLNKGAISYENPVMLTINNITPNTKESIDSKKPYEENIMYIDKIKELCDKNGVELILTFFPYSMDSDMVAYSQWIEEYADLIGCEYINFNDFEYDYATDFFDAGHTNAIGQLKTTRYIGNLLKEKEYYIDRRNGEYSKNWDNSLNVFNEFREDAVKDGKDINNSFWEQ